MRTQIPSTEMSNPAATARSGVNFCQTDDARDALGLSGLRAGIPSLLATRLSRYSFSKAPSWSDRA
jgi:hypothetical protein